MNQTPPAIPRPIPRTLEFALFLTGGLWVLAARSLAQHAARGFTSTLHFDIFYGPLLSAVFLLFLLLTGFCALTWVATRSATLRGVNALISRPTAAREWGIGAALGWAMVVLAILPMLLARDLHPTFWFAPTAFGHLLIELLILLVITLTQELILRGYLFVRLIRALGPTVATLLMSAIAAAVSAIPPQASRLSVLVTFLLSVLFSLAYLRTRALWLPWGLHFAWSASIGVVFGLPVSAWDFSSVVYTNARGPSWITGGAYGPEGALFTVVVVAIGMAALYTLTRDLAWEYTQPLIVAAGYAMDVAPPAEHTKMEQAAKPAPLVQILATTPSASSTLPVIDEHLRSSKPPDA